MPVGKGATPAIAEFEQLAIAYRVHEFEHDPSVTSFRDEAAGALGGIDPDRVFKTLVAAIGDELVVAAVGRMAPR